MNEKTMRGEDGSGERLVQWSTRVPVSMKKWLDITKAQTGKSVQKLLHEALSDLMSKYSDLA